jgi:hypothetical protein
MKTEQLIQLLAAGAGPAPQRPVLHRLLPVVVLGALASAAIAVAWLGCVPAEMFMTAAPWIKLAYAAALAASAGWLTARLSRPVARLAMPLRALVGVAVVMALLGTLAWASTPAPLRPAALMGQSWKACPLYVVVLAAPVLAGLLWAVRGLAPTRPCAAGAATGLLAGALGAAAYALVCVEDSTAFIALWYSAGIVITGGLGALLGPRVLRW